MRILFLYVDINEIEQSPKESFKVNYYYYYYYYSRSTSLFLEK